MTKRTRTGPTAERFIETTLTLIAEEGGSQNVNLREISRRMGCAHTNAYNYFASYEDLLWTAFHRTLRIYGEFLVHNLDDSLGPLEYLRRLVSNLATFPEENPGLYRFIASDPIDLDRIPDDTLELVSTMKTWLSEVLQSVVASDMDPDEAESVSSIVLAYIDGETLNLINDRVVPGEDVRGRIVDNALRLFRVLGENAENNPPPLANEAPRHPYPALNLETTGEGA